MENKQLISKATEYVRMHATTPELTIQEVSVHAGFSTDYFNRLFLQHTGFTVMAYINYIRTQQAAKLLRATEHSILDIALTVGFESHEGFSKAFKKYYGVNPREYRAQKKNQVPYWGEWTDSSVAARFLHENPDFRLMERDTVIDTLLKKNALQYGYLCTAMKYMGLAVAAPDGQIENGFLCIGDDKNGGSYLELVTDDLILLAQWLQRFPQARTFYSIHTPSHVEEQLGDNGVQKKLKAIPQSFYLGEKLPCELPADTVIRRLSYADKAYIEAWAHGRQDGYIQHLLREKDYHDPSVLEYGMFQNETLVATAGCGIDEVRGFRLNNCCVIRFSDGEATDNRYRLLFSFVVNDLHDKGILPFDDLQHGEYARSHGNFTAQDMGFQTVQWRYDLRI